MTMIIENSTNYASIIKSMQREQEARRILSGDLDELLQTLFRGAPLDFLASNGDFPNVLALGVADIVETVSAAALGWTGDHPLIGERFTPELVRLLAVEALLTGKIALFAQENQISALSGYIHPFFATGQALQVEKAIQIIPTGDAFEVREYTEHELSMATLRNINEWESVSKQRIPLKERSMILHIVRRDPWRRPVGLVTEAMPAFKRYAKTAVNRNAVAENAGWPERVIRSDAYRDLLLGNSPIAEQALSALKKVGPRQLKILGTNDDYAVQDGVDLQPHLTAEQTDRAAVLEALCWSDLSGGNLSGIALAERQNKSRQLVGGITSAIAHAVNGAFRALDIDAGCYLTPRWAQDHAARVAQVADLYSKGALPRSVALTELQSSGFSSIRDDLIRREEENELLDAGIVTGDEY